MASRIDIDITDFEIISALNTPGGGAYEWRNKTAEEIKLRAEFMAPVNDALNEKHRASRRGLYKASFRWDKVGSGGHRVRARIYNIAEHAEFVEFGRAGSRKEQTFSWTEWGGRINTVGGKFGGGTAPRDGEHILRDATNRVMATVATPLA